MGGVFPKVDRGGVIYTCSKPGTVAITYVGGPHPEHSVRIADAFSAVGQTANFFWYGRNIAANQEVALRILKDGHQVGLSGWQHRDFSTMRSSEIKEDIERAQESLHKATGEKAALFRSVSRETTWHLEQALAASAMVHIKGNIRIDRLYRTRTINSILEEYEDALECANPQTTSWISVQLESVDTSWQSVETVLDYIKWAGFRAISLSECLGQPAYQQPLCKNPPVLKQQ